MGTYIPSFVAVTGWMKEGPDAELTTDDRHKAIGELVLSLVTNPHEVMEDHKVTRLAKAKRDIMTMVGAI
eukprot:10408314-Heterocapsa_arctica.AAC.1